MYLSNYYCYCLYQLSATLVTSNKMSVIPSASLCVLIPCGMNETARALEAFGQK